MSDARIPWCAALAPVAAAIGDEATCELVKQFGGRRVHVRRVRGREGRLDAALGPEVVDRLAEALRFNTQCGGYWDVPMARTERLWYFSRKWRLEGLSVPQIAERLRLEQGIAVTDDTIRRQFRGGAPKPQQLARPPPAAPLLDLMNAPASPPPVRPGCCGDLPAC